MISKSINLYQYSILVTGVCGFLGSRLVQVLLDNGAFVVGIDYRNKVPKHFAAIMKHNSFEFISGTFNEKSGEALSKLISWGRKESAVFHMAGLAHAGECEKDPKRAFESNVLLTLQTLEFCRKNNIRKFVFPSTGLVYGDHLKLPAIEETPTFPVNIYVATKLSAETLIQGYARSFGISCAIVRLGNIYGPGGNSDTVVGTIVRQVKKGGKIVVCDLSPVRDFIYIDDVIEGFAHILVSMVKPECHIVNLSTGIGTSVQKLAETACRAAFIPANKIQSQKLCKHSKSTLVLNNNLLAKIAGWKPKYTLFEGLSLTLKDLD